MLSASDFDLAGTEPQPTKRPKPLVIEQQHEAHKARAKWVEVARWAEPFIGREEIRESLRSALYFWDFHEVDERPPREVLSDRLDIMLALADDENGCPPLATMLRPMYPARGPLTDAISFTARKVVDHLHDMAVDEYEETHRLLVATVGPRDAHRPTPGDDRPYIRHPRCASCEQRWPCPEASRVVRDAGLPCLAEVFERKARETNPHTAAAGEIARHLHHQMPHHHPSGTCITGAEPWKPPKPRAPRAPRVPQDPRAPSGNGHPSDDDF